MNAEQYLEQIKKIDELIVDRLKDYNRWVELATGLSGFSVGERVSATRNLQKGADAIGKYIDIEKEIDKLKEKREDIINTIRQLPKAEYKILYLLYVERKKNGDDYLLKELPSMFDKSYGWVKQQKSKALRHVQTMLDDKGVL